MKYYVGIDLGTTNSAICTYYEGKTRVWKSREQNDVTPSAIYIDRRGNKLYGMRAYNQAPADPDNAAVLFKRFMGTNETFHFKKSDITMTPVECSAEILKELFGYLPEDIRNSDEVAVVITVPAAFNQMKKDATLEAATLAGFKNVSLMQEPVAAVMTIMKYTSKEGIFLIYDLGGGTFDISIAENINGKVNLLSNGGVEMCGGRDIDRLIFNQIVVPWLEDEFDIDSDFLTDSNYSSFKRLCQWASERAKIDLSSNEETTISLTEQEAKAEDYSGNEMYLDINITREEVNNLISDLVEETIDAIRDNMHSAGITSNDVEGIVFIGGPTQYKPLRDMIAEELAVKQDININPMTAVAEGASIFAEAINWDDVKHSRKATRDKLKTKIGLTFNYETRTPKDKARVKCNLDKEYDNYQIEFINDKTGWTSGQATLTNDYSISLPIEDGENSFTVNVYDNFRNLVNIGNNKIVVVKSDATITAIPASHTISIEALDKIGGASSLVKLINKNDALPKKGTTNFKAGKTIKSGTSDSLNIKLWEGEIEYPITDNKYIGDLKITGNDFDFGVITTGADIEVEYEIDDSGHIYIEASIPSIGQTFANDSLYSRQEGQIDVDDLDYYSEQADDVQERINALRKNGVEDEALDKAEAKIEKVNDLNYVDDIESEDVNEAEKNILEAKKYLDKARKNNIKTVREIELNRLKAFYSEEIEKIAVDTDKEKFNILFKNAEEALNKGRNNFEEIIDNINRLIYRVLLRQDWFIIDLFKNLIKHPSNYSNRTKFETIKANGLDAIANDDIKFLRACVGELYNIQIRQSPTDMLNLANIIKG